MYTITIKKAYKNYSWNDDAKEKDLWEDQVETFETALAAISELTYALDNHPGKKILFRYIPEKE